MIFGVVAVPAAASNSIHPSAAAAGTPAQHLVSQQEQKQRTCAGKQQRFSSSGKG